MLGVLFKFGHKTTPEYVVDNSYSYSTREGLGENNDL